MHLPLLSRHNERDGVSNHQPHHCLLNCVFRRRSKKTSKPRVTGLCDGNSPVTGEFPSQMASNAENVSIWWRHHDQYFAGYLWTRARNCLFHENMFIYIHVEEETNIIFCWCDSTIGCQAIGKHSDDKIRVPYRCRTRGRFKKNLWALKSKSS